MVLKTNTHTPGKTYSIPFAPVDVSHIKNENVWKNEPRNRYGGEFYLAKNNTAPGITYSIPGAEMVEKNTTYNNKTIPYLIHWKQQLNSAEAKKFLGPENLAKAEKTIAKMQKKAEAAAKKTKKKGSVRLTPEEEFKLGEVTVNPAYVNMGKGKGVYENLQELNLQSPSNRFINLELSPQLTRSSSITSLNNVNEMFKQLSEKNPSKHELLDSGVGSSVNTSRALIKSKPGKIVYLPGSASSSKTLELEAEPLYAKIRKTKRNREEIKLVGADYRTPLSVGADYRTPLSVGADYRTPPLHIGDDYRVSSVNFKSEYELPHQQGNNPLYDLIPGQNPNLRFLPETNTHIPPYIPGPTFT